MATEQEVERVAGILAVSPLIEAPRLPAECWHGLARAALTAAEQVRASDGSADRDTAIEAAAKSIYEGKGDRVGIDYVGWDNEPESVKDQWRLDVRGTIDAYEAARQS